MVNAVRRRAATLALTCLLPARAAAWHDAATPSPDATAHSLAKGEVRLGLSGLEVGLRNGLSVGTYTLPWLVLAPSLTLKWEMLRRAPWAVAVGLAPIRVDYGRLDATALPAVLTILPVEVLVSWRRHRAWTLTGGLVHTHVHVQGSTPRLDRLRELSSVYIRLGGATALPERLQGVAAVGNTQALASAEWRLSRVTALQLRVRLLLHQQLDGAGVTAVRPDEDTTILVAAKTERDISRLGAAWSVVPGVHWSWEHVNLRLGLGYGHLNVPGLNLVTEERMPLPDLDVYWRF